MVGWGGGERERARPAARLEGFLGREKGEASPDDREHVVVEQRRLLSEVLRTAAKSITTPSRFPFYYRPRHHFGHATAQSGYVTTVLVTKWDKYTQKVD